ncbi:hypothetical protein M527_26405 [Sphingobium indicum IP26]|nr:hypothetical protein M527_26405 [Sphingobium indicum IP26]EQB02604.1 hypothetical protein L286_14030 [Sphingobium sp. HDIP04]
MIFSILRGPGVLILRIVVVVLWIARCGVHCAVERMDMRMGLMEREL